MDKQVTPKHTEEINETLAALRDAIINDPDHKLNILIKKSEEVVKHLDRRERNNKPLTIEEKILLKCSL